VTEKAISNNLVLEKAMFLQSVSLLLAWLFAVVTTAVMVLAFVFCRASGGIGRWNVTQLMIIASSGMFFS
jgi:hypothetical protein